MSKSLKELNSLYRHKKRLETENDMLRAALKEIRWSYSHTSKAFKIAKKALGGESIDTRE